MKVSPELCEKLTTKMAVYGIELEDADCQNAYWAVINTAGQTNLMGESLINKEARIIWDAWVAEKQAEAAPADPEPES